MNTRSPEFSARQHIDDLDQKINDWLLSESNDPFVQLAKVLIDTARATKVQPQMIIQALQRRDEYQQLFGTLNQADENRLNRATSNTGYIMLTATEKSWNDIDVLAGTCLDRISALRRN